MRKNEYSITAVKILTSNNNYIISRELEKYEPETLYEFLKFALNNRILYALSRRILESSPEFKYLRLIEYIVREGDKWQTRLKNTLNYLNDIFGEEQFIVIKTFRKIQDITFDVDIMIANNDLKIFYEKKHQIKKKFKIRKIACGYELIPKSDDYLAIDIYTCFEYNDKRLFSEKIILNNPRKVRLGYNTYLVPPYEGELLLYLTQVLFQLRFLTLGDFIQIVHLMNKNISWNLIISEAKEHNWNYLLRLIVSLIKDQYRKYFNVPLALPTLLESTNNEYKSGTFPIILPPISSIIGYSIFHGARDYFISKKIIKDIHYILLEYFNLHFRGSIPIYRSWIDIPRFDKRSFRYSGWYWF